MADACRTIGMWRRVRIATWVFLATVFALVASGAWAGPLMEWGTYLGDGGDDEAKGVAVDSAGNVYVVGDTYRDYGAFVPWVQGGGTGTVTVHHGSMDGFVAKFAPDGTHIWSTFVGGSEWDAINAITIASIGGEDVIYLAGWTSSTDWIAGGHDTTPKGDWDGFVAKMNTSGSLLWSSYLGGTDTDVVIAIAVDRTDGSILAAGHTKSAGWLAGGWDWDYNGDMDGFVAKLSGANGQIQWGSYLGGESDDAANCVAVSPSGNVYVGGYSYSAGWVAYGWDNSHAGSQDGFIVRLNSSGLHWWSSYLGGSGSDSVKDIVLDASENVFATGSCGSDASWVSGGWNTLHGGLSDGFAAMFTMQGVHVRSGLFGGANLDNASAVALDSVGNVYISGLTHSSNLTSGGWDTTQNGQDAFVAMLKPGLTGLWWSSYVGGSGTEYGSALAVSHAGAIYIGSRTSSSDWPTGGWDSTYGGAGGNGIGDGYLLGAGPTTGSIKVSITPTLAVLAGAQWRLQGTTEWKSSGAVDANALIGPRTIEFKPINNWTKPSNIDLTLAMDQEVAYSRAYVFNGTLRVTLFPAEAVAAGARWRRKGTSTWMNSGASESVSPSVHTIEFKPIAGWRTPVEWSVLVQSGQTKSTEETYGRNMSAWMLH